jgi:hypothetical protein
MWTLSGLRVWIIWAIKLGKDVYVYGGSVHKNLSTQIEEGEGCLPAEDWSRGVPFIGQAGRPAPTGLGGFVPLPGSISSQHDHFSSMTFLPACSTSCTTQTLSSTPFLALLVLPLDASCFESCPCPLLHLLHMSPWISCKVMLAAYPCLSFAYGLDESWWKGIQWCMHD